MQVTGEVQRRHVVTSAACWQWNRQPVKVTEQMSDVVVLTRHTAALWTVQQVTTNTRPDRAVMALVSVTATLADNCTTAIKLKVK